MIDAKPTRHDGISGHFYGVRATAEGPTLAWIPEKVVEDRTALLELRDALISHISNTQPAPTDWMR